MGLRSGAITAALLGALGAAGALAEPNAALAAADSPTADATAPATPTATATSPIPTPEAAPTPTATVEWDELAALSARPFPWGAAQDNVPVEVPHGGVVLATGVTGVAAPDTASPARLERAEPSFRAAALAGLAVLLFVALRTLRER